MTAETLQRLRDTYRDGLLEDVIPFWLRHAIDSEHGGYMTALNREGTVIDTDKAVWPQGRFAWMLSTLYNTVEPREEWLDAARNGIEFLERHAFDDDGRMFFLLTREGQPLRKRRYAFSEAFASIAYAAFARATGEDRWAERARACFQQFQAFATGKLGTEPKVNPETRPTRAMGLEMIRINLAQELRENLGDDTFTPIIDQAIENIDRYFVNRELRAVLEVCGPKGEVIDHFDGRTLNPGHAIEAAWFILHESRLRGGDSRLTELGCTILDWMWERGWDREHGGLLYFVDLHDHPVQEYWHDMKFWWPHNEAVIATLLAHRLSGDARYAEQHRLVHDWTYNHFPDTEHGEWFGYLHRDGTPSSTLKGNNWKGPFHIPRMQWYAYRLCDEWLESGS